MRPATDNRDVRWSTNIGESARYIHRIIVTPTSSKEFRQALASLASCPPTPYLADSVPEAVRQELTVETWPAACMPALRIGAHVIRVPAPTPPVHVVVN